MGISTYDLVAHKSTYRSLLYLHISALTIQWKAIQRCRPTTELLSLPLMRHDNEITKLMFCAETGKLVGWRVVDHVTLLLRISVSSNSWDSPCFVSKCFSYVGTNFSDKRRSLGQYSSLADKSRGVCLFGISFLSRNHWTKAICSDFSVRFREQLNFWWKQS
jgi:hypothetical protein